MSRVGKKPIEMPSGVEAKLETGKITVKGPLGEISQDVHPKLINIMTTRSILKQIQIFFIPLSF